MLNFELAYSTFKIQHLKFKQNGKEGSCNIKKWKR